MNNNSIAIAIVLSAAGLGLGYYFFIHKKNQENNQQGQDGSVGGGGSGGGGGNIANTNADLMRGIVKRADVQVVERALSPYAMGDSIRTSGINAYSNIVDNAPSSTVTTTTTPTNNSHEPMATGGGGGNRININRQAPATIRGRNTSAIGHR